MGGIKKGRGYMKRMIPVTVRDRIATKTGDEEYICGNSDFTILFDFDAEWDAWPTKTARFTWAGNYHDVLFEGSECPVPVISDVFHFKVGVYAGNLRTTTAARVPAKKSVLCVGGIQHKPPETDVYNEILEKVNGRVTQEQMEQAIDNTMDAEFLIVRVQTENIEYADKTFDEIDRAASDGKLVFFVDGQGKLYSYVGEMPYRKDETIIAHTFGKPIEYTTGKIEWLVTQILPDGLIYMSGNSQLKVPNPYKVKFTGAVNAEYDGSQAITVKIPEGGTGGGSGMNLVDGEADGSLRSVYSTEESEEYKLGKYAVAVGHNTKASGEASFAEGRNTEASGVGAHVEGITSKAIGIRSHAENGGTQANGDDSHSEGLLTKANGRAAHVEGCNTVAEGEYQHVQGKYNLEDTEGRYAHIVGNGGVDLEIRDIVRKNAHTLDWSGNGWYAGDLYVGGTSQDDAQKLVTEKELEEAVKNAGGETGGGVDFEVDENTLTLKDGILSVNTTDKMEADNTQPITSAGVYTQVGNINALLATI